MREHATLADYWMALYTRKGIILAVALSAMVFAMAITRYLPPVYEAKATLYVPANLSPKLYGAPLGPAQLPLRPQPDDREAGIHVGILRSNDMIEAVQRRFPQKEAGFFKKNVNFVTSPQFFTDIYVRDRDPRLAADIANAYVEAYRDFHANNLRNSAERTVKALEGKVAELRTRLVAKRAELLAYQESNKVLSGSATERLYLRQREDLERQRDENALAISSARQRLLADGVVLGPNDTGARDDAVLANPRLEQLKALEARQTALGKRIDELARTTGSAISETSSIQNLESDKRVLEQQLVNTETNLAETRLQIEFPNVEVVQVQVARPPSVPGFPIMTLNAIVALIVGLAAGCYCALLLEYLRQLRLERIRRQLDDSPLTEAAP
ncbi:Wzz/FepE/Etk N-terminal domain-containing protein [Ideonella sp. DXS22W]|uniref:Wzz/FepE/Etk N-terminal domain-containing protein n=1 Tax=Pseudaquabacterium inlustre TaxID=2984192 RepID=A0ABU9CH20_9BURK